MREREQLSAWEKDYISSRLTGWKVASFFLPGLWQMWSKRWWLFRWWLCITLWLGLLWYATWDSDAMEWAGRISWLINVILTLVKFTEKAYRHDMSYFKPYLDEYHKMYWNNKDSEMEDEEDIKEYAEPAQKRDNKNLYYNELDAYWNTTVKYRCAECKWYVNEDDEECPNCWRVLRSKWKNLDTKHSSNSKYDKFGYDKDGYNREWYDAYWFDRDGYNREWYNEEWFDRNWFDKSWYNYKWFDKDWYDKNGYNKRWYDRNGLDKDGYDKYENRKEAVKKPTKKVAKKNVRK